jgi:sulfite reductase (NADPH) flavoprotein alpha-component
MFFYFGYGSNMNFTSLKAKGADPITSVRSTLSGWKLRFNVEHFFKHEGGMGNIEYTGNENDKVFGVAHQLSDEALSNLDEAEAYGVGYDRIKVTCDIEGNPQECFAYVGYPSFINDNCLPTRRYLNILIDGAKKSGLAHDHVHWLECHEILKKTNCPKFVFPDHPDRVFDVKTIANGSIKTAIAGAVFHMTNARARHNYLKKQLGGKDVTLFHLKRMDSSSGNETIEDIKYDRLNGAQKIYLNEYLHAFNEEYEYAGRFTY